MIYHYFVITLYLFVSDTLRDTLDAMKAMKASDSLSDLSDLSGSSVEATVAIVALQVHGAHGVHGVHGATGVPGFQRGGWAMASDGHGNWPNIGRIGQAVISVSPFRHMTI